LKALTPSELQAGLKDLPRWVERDGKLCRKFEFEDFVSAFSFMTAVALVSESRDHHPEWTNVYGTVDVALVTHDAGGITTKDLELAHAMDRLACVRNPS